MKDGSEVTISNWTDDQATVDVDPLFVTLSDKIAVGLVEPGENKSLAELEHELKSYQSAAKSAGARARVLVRLSADAKDDVFRTSLKALATQGFLSVEMTRSPK
jgi:biopolymer transport protein ExbD